METVGIRVDVPYFRELGSFMGESLARLEKEIQAAAGVEFNPASPKQVGEVLFDKLMLPVQKKTSKTKSYSTDSEVLETLRGAHPVVPLLLEHRILAKLKGTYADPLPSWADSQGRLHAAFHQTATATGRLSSSDPNLQNIPARGDWGPKIRHGFLAQEGFLLCGADYSQIELRVLAHLCGDAALKRIFERGEDIHTATAAEVFGVAPMFLTPDMRRQAKAVNFGILYGMGPFGLARELGVSQREAKAFIERYFQRFSSVRAYLDGVEKEVLEKEQVSTILGRRRLFPGIARAPKPLQAALLRQAVNTTVQGSAADLIKKAMVDVEPHLPAGANLVLQVHDELIVEVPEGWAQDAGRTLQSAMEGALSLDVPLVAGVSTGKRWDELK
jgi:DNA polymerase-1